MGAQRGLERTRVSGAKQDVGVRNKWKQRQRWSRADRDRWTDRERRKRDDC